MGRLVFISYRRERGYALAHLVNAELRSRGLRTFIDVAESDPGQFWPQAHGAIRSCCAVVLICTNGSFQPRAGDDWVLREVSEAMGLGRPIVPVFSQDFEPPSALPPPLAEAIQYNGVSMDTQFHVAAFDHLSQLVGGRKRSEQRRRVAMFWSLASLTLLALLALGARDIIRLNGEIRQEREARQAERRAAEERSKEVEKNLDAAEERSKKLEKNLAGMERSSANERRAAAEQEHQAEVQRQRRHSDCINRCYFSNFDCEQECIQTSKYAPNSPAQKQCYETCKQYDALCKNGCPW